MNKKNDEYAYVENPINIVGEQGKSLFYFANLNIVSYKKIQKEIQNNLNDYLKRYDKIKDDRALAIIGALCIENELDKFLSIWLMDYKSIKHLTFNRKIELAIATKLMPKWILQAIEPIREIRNIFAHNLKVNNFKEAKKIKASSFKNMNDCIEKFYTWKDNNDSKTFRQLLFFILLSIDTYSKHIKKVSDFIWNEHNLHFCILWDKKKVI